MSKKTIVAIVIIAVLLLIGFGIYKFAGHSNKITKQAPSTTQTSKQTTLASLKELIAGGVSQSCTYSADKTSGTIYMGSGKVRADINMAESAENVQTSTSHMIILNGENYIWVEGKNTGYKMTYNPEASPSSTGNLSSNYSLDPNTNMNYNCTPWLIDDTKFTLPKDVNFLDITKLNNQNTSTEIDSKCSYCETLASDDKTKCLVALKCK